MAYVAEYDSGSITLNNGGMLMDEWVAGIAWVVIRIVSEALFSDTDSAASTEYLPVAAGILSCFCIFLVGTAQCALLFVSTRKIAGSYCSKGRGRG